MSLMNYGETPLKIIDKNYHLGHFFIDTMLENSDYICQIDEATGEEETRRSVLTRSIHLARCLRRLGFQPGDVLAWGGYNHLDLYIPYYAALLNGLPIAGIDPSFKYDEVKHLFKQIEPKIAFCQRESLDYYRKAVADLSLDTRLVTFDGEDNNMTALIEECDKTGSIEDFEVASFDTEKVYAWLVCTSGSTGLPKVAAIKHEPIFTNLMYYKTFATKTLTLNLNISGVQWIAAFYNPLSFPAMNQIRLQTSAPATIEHIIDIINKYRPKASGSSPLIIYQILKHEKPCDLSCFNSYAICGTSVHKKVLVELKAALRADARLFDAYGQTESLGLVLRHLTADGPLGNCGQERPEVKIKLVDPVTEETITEPNVPGELWTKGPIFSEYYRNPEETAKVLTPDGWFKTGDLLRRDEDGYFFFVERLKMLIKFRHYQVTPMELEEVILEHDGVREVCVTSIPHAVDGEWPVAVVVRRPGSAVTAQQIKDLVANKLSVHKQLRGGVVFVDALPMTSTGKIARAKVRQLVETASLE